MGFCGITKARFRKLLLQNQNVALFANHETGEMIPMELVHKIKARVS
jgi:hypothetical protein